MQDLVLKTLLCIVIPLLFLLVVLDKRSKIIISALICGAIGCLIAYYIDTALYNFSGCSYFYLTTNYSPVIEECIKFVPLILCAIFITNKKEQLVPVAFAIGIGYAIIENSYMLLQYEDTANISWLITRGLGAGLMHAIVTSVAGYGLSRTIPDKRLRVVGTISLLFFAIIYHGTYNCIVQIDSVTYMGILLPLLTFFALVLVYYKDGIKQFWNS